MSRFWVEKQNWQRFPRVLTMCKDDGMNRKFVRYVREDKTKEDHDRVVVMFNAEYLARQNVEIENARLRELARDAMKSACTGCPHKRAWRSCDGCNLHEKAAALGMEVEL